jgi:Chaperone of endosialidase
MSVNFPVNPLMNQVYTNLDRAWMWNGRFWQATSATIGYTGSQGAGYTGSQGDIGYTGSQGDIGYTGSQGAGYTGSQGDIGYTGSMADTSNFIKLDPDGDGICVAYSDQNPTINNIPCNGGWIFGADGNLNSGLLEAKFINARNGSINSSGGYYIGTINPLEDPNLGTYTTKQIISADGLIMPTAGSADTNGIKFPNDPGDGTEDTAWIRYYSYSLKNTNLEIGISNNSGDDSINFVSPRGVGVNMQDPSEALHVNGNVLASGTINSASDARLKSNIKTIADPLRIVANLRGVLYTTNGNQDGTGVIAQEVEQVVPCLVGTDRNGMKNVSYGNFAGIFIESIKELTAQIEELRAEINRLKDNS